MVVNQSHATSYFETEGRENLKQVIKLIKRALGRRESLRDLKLVFFTAYGEGPVLATTLLRDFKPKMIAVTFPPTFEVVVGETKKKPEFTKEVEAFLAAMGVTIIRSRLPFDGMDGVQGHTCEMNTIKNTLGAFGGSFPLCVQAVLQACDSGAILEGETVIGVTGDCAAIIRACPTKSFASAQSQFFVKEFICRAADRRWNRFPRKTEENSRIIEGMIKVEDHLLGK